MVAAAFSAACSDSGAARFSRAAFDLSAARASDCSGEVFSSVESRVSGRISVSLASSDSLPDRPIPSALRLSKPPDGLTVDLPSRS